MVKILIAGDFCPKNRVSRKLENEEYEFVFEEVKPYIKEVDCSIVNLECPIADSYDIAIKKIGPSLKTTPKAIEALKWVGFDTVTLANNHFRDYGDSAICKTLENLKNKNIQYVGGGINIKEASDILYKEIQGKKIAILNACEHEFSIATDDTAGSNPIDSIKQYYQIKEAKRNADHLIVIIHGGCEMYQLPTIRMKQLYRYYIDCGADVVVNHHQHCYSGYEIYKGSPIFYGLGNFCFDSMKQSKTKTIWNTGYMVELCISDNITFNMIPYEQCIGEPKVHILQDVSAFEQNIRNLNEIIDNDELLKECFRSFAEKVRVDVKLSPYTNKYLLAALWRKMIPSFVNRKQKSQLSHMINCESHLDVMKEWLNIRM